MPITTSPYMSRKRRYESNANVAPAFTARPFLQGPKVKHSTGSKEETGTLLSSEG